MPVVVVDWDVVDLEDEEGPRVTQAQYQGNEIRAHVGSPVLQSLSKLRGTATEALLQQAEGQ
jgi:hypothetical protein